MLAQHNPRGDLCSHLMNRKGQIVENTRFKPETLSQESIYALGGQLVDSTMAILCALCFESDRCM